MTAEELLQTYLLSPMSLFISQVVLFLPKIIAAYILWLIGKWVIDWIGRHINRLDIKGMTFDDHIRNVFRTAFIYTAKFVLILVILDTLSIGSNVIAAITNSLTFAIAIAVGLAFGRALEPDAQQWVDRLRSYARDHTNSGSHRVTDRARP